MEQSCPSRKTKPPTGGIQYRTQSWFGIKHREPERLFQANLLRKPREQGFPGESAKAPQIEGYYMPVTCCSESLRLI